MNIGDAFISRDIADFSTGEAEEILMVMRYICHKEKSYEKKAVIIEFIMKVEEYLNTTYITDLDTKINDFNAANQLN